LLILAQPALIAEYLTAIFTDIAIVEPVVPSETILVQPAGALSDFIRAHGLEPMNSVGQLGAADSLLSPAADDLPQTIAERRADGRSAQVPQLWEIGAE
jgi:hypothetical protein